MIVSNHKQDIIHNVFTFVILKTINYKNKESEEKCMWKEFKEFIMKGNVMDLAVAVVVGAAFTNLVNSVVDGFIGPVVSLAIKAILGSDEDSMGLVYTNKRFDVTFDFGTMIYALISFLITAFVVFLIVKALNELQKKLLPIEEKQKEAEEKEALEPTEEYLKEIVMLLKEQQKEQHMPQDTTGPKDEDIKDIDSKQPSK